MTSKGQAFDESKQKTKWYQAARLEMEEHIGEHKRREPALASPDPAPLSMRVHNCSDVDWSMNNV